MKNWWLTPQALSQLAAELNAHFVGARVQKVQQIGSKSIVAELHHLGETHTLLMQADEPVVLCLVSHKPARTLEGQPPAFQGLLRKHLAPARVEECVAHAAEDRIVLKLGTTQGARSLVFESRSTPNVLLVHENGNVLGAAQPSLLQQRGLRVGKPYVAPHAHELTSTPLPSANIRADHPLLKFPTHAMVEDSAMNAVAPQEAHVETQSRRALKAHADKLQRLIKALKQDIAKADASETMQRAAELAKAQLGELQRGVSSWTLRSPFDESVEPVTVKVDPALTPLQNMEKLFHQARRLQTTRKMVLPRLEDAQRRQGELMALIHDVDSGVQDLDARIAAWVGEKKLARKSKGPTRRQPFRAFVTSQGMRVLCGKSKEDNAQLTHKVARGNDVFLHARDAHGSHVILVVEGQPQALDAAIGEAALIAAHYSEAKEQNAVDVRYTEVKHVRAVPGHIGLVTLAKERVKRVRMDDPRLKAMLARSDMSDRR